MTTHFVCMYVRGYRCLSKHILVDVLCWRKTKAVDGINIASSNGICNITATLISYAKRSLCDPRPPIFQC